MHVNDVLVNNATLALYLSQAGYSVGMFGKYLNTCPDADHVPPGFSAYFANGLAEAAGWYARLARRPSPCAMTQAAAPTLGPSLPPKTSRPTGTPTAATKAGQTSTGLCGARVAVGRIGQAGSFLNRSPSSLHQHGCYRQRLHGLAAAGAQGEPAGDGLHRPQGGPRAV